MRSVSTALLAVCVLCCGCSGPNETVNRDYEKKARAERTPIVLTADVVNKLVEAARNNKASGVLDKTYSIVASVESSKVTIESKGEGSEVLLYVRLPSYQAVSITCHFHSGHEQEVRSMKAGQAVSLRGVLTSCSDRSFDFNGCLPEP